MGSFTETDAVPVTRSSNSIVRKMRALRVEAGETKASLKQVDVPALGPSDLLIKVESAILAPDVFGLVRAGKLLQAPTTLGHKVAGTIAQRGPEVEHLQTGQRVRLDPNLNCGSCTYCRSDRDQMCSQCGIMGFFALAKFPRWERYHPGGLADYIRVPASQVDVLPDSISCDTGAKIHDLANALRAFKNCELAVGATVVLLAATGAMGTCCIKLAPFFGVGRLILVARSIERLQAVAKLTSVPCECVGLDTLGDDWVASRALGRRISELAPEGVNAVIDYSPSGEDMWQVFDALAIGGTFVPIGGNWSVTPFPARILTLKCWRIIGTRNHSKEDSRTIIDLLKRGQLHVEDLVTAEFALQDIEKAIEQLRDRSRPSWMLMIRP
jgi:threonine dehydrogenase-like Zn-dependent dehydrogenase